MIICAVTENGYTQTVRTPPPGESFGKVVGSNTNGFAKLLEKGDASLNSVDASAFLSPKESVKGCRFFLNKWMNGTVINSNGVLVRDDKLLFYYDKIKQSLYYTVDKKQVMEADTSHIRSFILNDGDNLHYFKRVVLIKPALFFESLIEYDRKYSLYKLTSTRLIKSDYQTSVSYGRGDRGDQYIDEFKYYIVFPEGKTFQPVSLKKKPLKEIFKKTNSQMNTYFSQHEEENIDEGFLKNMVIYLNQEGQ